MNIGGVIAFSLLILFCAGLTPTIIDYSSSLPYETWTFTGHSMLAAIMSNFGIIWVVVVVLVPVGYMFVRETRK